MTNGMRTIVVIAAVLVLLSCLNLAVYAGETASAKSVSPPSQPQDGPGGSRLPHASVTKQAYGEGAGEYWIFEPSEPRPASAPLVIFLHGWGGMNPKNYGGWIDHIVRRGNIVVYPRYQESLRTRAPDFTPNTLAAIASAVKRLKTESGHVMPELDKFAVVGHSLGGLLTANVAALAAEHGLPQVRAAMSVEPGGSLNGGDPVVPIADLSKIPAGTLLIALAGEDDTLVKDALAKHVYQHATRVSAEDKDYVILPSDAHGSPALKATHAAPSAPDPRYGNREAAETKDDETGGIGRGQILRRLMGKRTESSGRSFHPLQGASASDDARGIDALDYYGMWKLFDALCDAAFYGKNREYALGNTPQQRFMGQWSDGTAVKELTVTDQP